jgi:cell division transport system permease protein
VSLWWRHQQQALSGALRRLARAPLATLLSVLVIGVTLALPAGLYVILNNLNGLTSRLNAEPQISIFLALDASDAEVQAVQSQLKTNPTVANVNFVSREEALAEMKRVTGLEDVMQALDKNPLPHAFVVRAKDSGPEVLEGLRTEFAKLPKVDSVTVDAAWAKRLASLNSAGEKIVLLLTVVLGIALLAVIGNTIRLQVLTQREEIEVGRLIGATDAFIRRPYLYFGAMQGLVGGLLALGLALAGITWLAGSLSGIIALYAPDFRPQLWRPEAALLVAGGAALLGWLGAYASVSLYLTQIKPR